MTCIAWFQQLHRDAMVSRLTRSLTKSHGDSNSAHQQPRDNSVDHIRNQANRQNRSTTAKAANSRASSGRSSTSKPLQTYYQSRVKRKFSRAVKSPVRKRGVLHTGATVASPILLKPLSCSPHPHQRNPGLTMPRAACRPSRGKNESRLSSSHIWTVNAKQVQ
ncbi:unnamed protein product [Protopolystoma xenopodis]|uniref:Uncharacterized protein n=1 Tax=Protopolystoma xenopodis TaxID=117903 RepID=A0A3S4ZW57_9PLAT|nr:unnamed protein product [Protopolystoma xenopodis]